MFASKNDPTTFFYKSTGADVQVLLKGWANEPCSSEKSQKSGHTNPRNNIVICLNTGTIGEGSSAVVGGLSCGYMFILFNFFFVNCFIL